MRMKLTGDSGNQALKPRINADIIMNQLAREQFHQDFEAALAFATRLHAGQVRKKTDIPYISHLIGVAGLVLEYGGDSDEAIAALLHDAIEDQAAGYAGGATQLRSDIRTQFGDKVLRIVEGCTDSETLPKPSWKQRKQHYIDHVCAVDDSTRLVSCADKLHNARAIVSDLRVFGDALFDRFGGGKGGTLWYYRSLADTFLELGNRRIAEELDRTVQEMERLAQA
jgi:(p)ppGpp synthase/HD superfamily hydrolase